MKSEALRRVIKRLPRQMRIVLEGRFWEQKTLEEIALKLRVTEGKNQADRICGAAPAA
jgi:DNA-directed RNA polymerase specialized sigma24 family protein